jgi:hypothetical protein
VDGSGRWRCDMVYKQAQGPIASERRRGKSQVLIQCNAIYRKSLRMCLNLTRMRKLTHDEGGKSKAITTAMIQCGKRKSDERDGGVQVCLCIRWPIMVCSVSAGCGAVGL